MSAFVSKGGRTPKVYVYDRHGRKHRRTLGTSEYPELAPAVEARVKAWRTERRWDVLDALVARNLTACEAYRAELAGTLPALLTERAAIRAAEDAAAADVDLSPLVDELVADAKYRTQIRRLIPAGERFPASHFSRKRIAEFIRNLHTVNRFHPTAPTRKASPATKARYRAALSVFAKALIENEVIADNPVQHVSLPRQSRADERVIYLEPEDAKRVVLAQAGAQRALEALMVSTGMEWGACAVLTRKDIDTARRIVWAKGTKNRYRDRYVEVVDEWAWAILADYIATLTPHARLFTMTEERALRRHQAACRALGVTVTTNHQYRHCFAVRHLKAQCDHQWLKNQLGHAPHSTLIYTTYGKYIEAAKLSEAQERKLGRTHAEADSRSNTKQNTSPRNDLKSEAR